MFLDTLKLRSAVLQVQFAAAFELWDHAGSVAQGMTRIWSDLAVTTGEPMRVILQGRGVAVRTELTSGVVALTKLTTIDGKVSQQLKDAVECWRDCLQISEFTRVSMVVEYGKEFPTLREANEALFKLGLVRWPTEKVFDQPTDGAKNGVDVSFRFEDENAFAVVRARAEGLIYEMTPPPHSDKEPTKEELHRLLVSFDRGNLKAIPAKQLKVDEWIKGYVHVMRRDISKVLEGRL